MSPVVRPLDPLDRRSFPSVSSRCFLGACGLVLSLAGPGCARRTPHDAGVDRIAVAIAPARPLGTPRSAGVLVIPATGEARDVAAAAGSLWIATPGATVAYPSGEAPRVVGWSEGLGTTAPTAVIAAGRDLVVGGADGLLTVISSHDSGAESQIVRLGGAPVVDLAADDRVVYVATRAGLYVWPLGATAATHVLPGGDVEALALGPGGLAVGLADGSISIAGADGIVRSVAPAGDEPVTALAWNGDGLWVGRAGGLERWDGGRRARVRADVHVTALLTDGHALLVGTPDAGVLALDEGGGERRLLGDAHVTRLRRVDGAAVAIADGGVYGLADGAPLVGPAPAGLAVSAVSAIALLGDEVWVGGERGVDVFDGRGAWLRRAAPGARVLALMPRSAAEMIIATTDGALVVGERGSRRVGEREGLLGRRVTAAAALAAWSSYTTDLGATLIDERGVAVRLASGVELPAGGASAVAWGTGGKLFVATPGGLVVVAGTRVQRTLALGAVEAIAVGGAGVYAATAAGIVLVRDDGSSATLGGPRASALAVEPGSAGGGERIFAGSAAGLDVREETWKAVRGPLPAAAVTAIAVGEDAIWIGTDQGLVRMSRAALETTLAPPRS